MRILVCDDHAVFRAGLRAVLGELADASELLEAADVAQALALASENADIDLALLDLHMPGTDGRTGLRQLRAAHPTLPVVIVSAADDPAEMRHALDDGASGFVPKSARSEELVAALRLVLAGGVYVPRAALAASAGADTGAQRRMRRRERAGTLTTRQIEVLSLMARGLTNREICGVLSIAEGTVKTHVAAIFETLEVTNRTEAAVVARELGLKAPGEE
ncbi:MAG TPA: response regulator transcription factor [Myxococcota bacterium]|nr:response regulator transcription factor [Myxococcota bacterium]